MKTSCKIQHLVPRYVRNAKYDDIVDVIEFYKSDILEGDMKDEFECWKVKWNRESRTEADLPGNVIDNPACEMPERILPKHLHFVDYRRHYQSLWHQQSELSAA